ncbi:Rv3235 family protein [Jiangella asiatica]|uniref:Uncharacterized protein n=1 Tax=Jiangella asiatica TaxID=2530372 RepID=A0A4R5DXW1_9ACTN|nr:Rv3235 family protein [Jiangella asiatica]TDE15963.1 hypothetical protein E1269_01330 [Jiangella asiatica]
MPTTTSHAAAGPASTGRVDGGRVRRLPLPVCEPPFDDELGIVPATSAVQRSRAPSGHVQGTLAVSVGPSAQPAEPPALVVDDLPFEGSTPAAAAPAALPDPRRWTATLAQAAIEGVHGRRSLQQLVRWTDEAVFRALARRAADQPATPTARPRVRTIRACRVTDTVAETCVVVQLGRRVSAVAVRLEAVDDRWVCTAFDLVERPSTRRPGKRRSAGGPLGLEGRGVAGLPGDGRVEGVAHE